MQDAVFTSVFVSLSLTADVLARLRLLPPDPKRPTAIVDRKVPGVIALLTLATSTYLAPIVNNSHNDSGFLHTLFVDPPDVELARKVQLSICVFSAVTSFLDIRWRDRFDYGPDDQLG